MSARSWNASSVCPAVFELGLLRVGQREVHVVAAEQDVVAHRDALEGQLAIVLEHRDQREVRGAAAHVYHQQHLTEAQLLAPVGAPLEPAVERGLRLLQQRHGGQAGLTRGFERELARRRVERRGHRERDVLLREGVARVRVIPRGPQVAQVARRRGDRRHTLHALGGVRGQERRAAVHARVAQPALGALHQAQRRAGPQLAREGAHQGAGRRVPGQRQAAARQLSGEREIQARRQERAPVHLPEGHGLRHAQQRLRGGRRRLLEVDVRQRGVRGAEVDAHGEAGAHPSSTSAGASTRPSWPATSLGRRTSVARQPR
jgi:hypothetical protein